MAYMATRTQRLRQEFRAASARTDSAARLLADMALAHHSGEVAWIPSDTVERYRAARDEQEALWQAYSDSRDDS